jgi:hypothetical protein
MRYFLEIHPHINSSAISSWPRQNTSGSVLRSFDQSKGKSVHELFAKGTVPTLAGVDRRRWFADRSCARAPTENPLSWDLDDAAFDDSLAGTLSQSDEASLSSFRSTGLHDRVSNS